MANTEGNRQESVICQRQWFTVARRQHTSGGREIILYSQNQIQDSRQKNASPSKVVVVVLGAPTTTRAIQAFQNN